ncbi:hypothetical protein PC129_g7730 [Phytophthora cactorum]|uniref:Integrase zinc-binding domain-containing protein n=1 Tax=Phytophthora cactorum TaxID=29920 RepID=A0A329RYU7_9STRA|nr:hypothetical protein Pcac1_g12992 [Phytophthora cactorum]KAG2825054.1 hypothetical protein PC112_g9856 [Phytophthora cactorum]KAG2826954.1 hypothetical protein PC111_g8768 [Phytophthora cactorum]KAG2858054.1 hypothetical protein PC113_g10140 [Phytophthora cactorum]KAG2899579.1 hypothetical protein PC115_g16489 [Phytophthora cactorum]
MVDKLRVPIENMHREITLTKEVQTKRNKNNQRGAQPVNFRVGDYVVWSRADTKVHVNKLAVKWIGPYRVIGANANSFEIEHLLTGATRNIDASRLKLYADNGLDVNDEILEHIAN